MFKDLSGVVNGKTLIGVLLGIMVGALMAFTDIANSIGYIPPELVNTLLAAIPTILTLFGIWDSSQDSFDTIKEQLAKFFASSPALGLVLNIVIQTLNSLPTMEVADWIQTVGIVIGGILVAFGLKGQSVQARAALSQTYSNRN